MKCFLRLLTLALCILLMAGTATLYASSPPTPLDVPSGVLRPRQSPTKTGGSAQVLLAENIGEKGGWITVTGGGQVDRFDASGLHLKTTQLEGKQPLHLGSVKIQGKILVGVVGEDKLQTWSLETGKLQHSWTRPISLMSEDNYHSGVHFLSENVVAWITNPAWSAGCGGGGEWVELEVRDIKSGKILFENRAEENMEELKSKGIGEPIGFSFLDQTSVSANGRWITLDMGDGEVTIWDQKGRRAHKPKTALSLKDAIHSDFQFIPNSNKLMILDGKSLSIRDPESGNIEKSWPLEMNYRGFSSLSSKGDFVALNFEKEGSKNRVFAVHIWSKKAHRVIASIEGLEGPSVLGFSHSGNELLSFGDKGEVFRWSLNSLLSQ